MTGFNDVILKLEQLGVAEIILPFILVFALVFAVLMKVGIFGTDEEYKRRYSMIVALVMALAVIFPHVTKPGTPYDVVPIINNALPSVALLAIAIVALFVVLAVFNENVSFSGTGLGSIFVFLSIIAIALIFIKAAGWEFGKQYTLPSFMIDPTTQTLLVIGILTVLFIGWVTGKKKTQPSKAFEKFGKGFKDLFKVQ